MIIKLWLIFLIFLFTFCYGKPVKVSHKSRPHASKVETNTDALKYFDKFGYNKCANHGNKKGSSREPVCQSSFKTMLEHFQTVYHLPVTGELDDATIKLMNRPRCSLGDYPSAYSTFRPWSNKTLKWKLHNEIPEFGREKTRLHIQESFNDWARYAPLTFREANYYENADLNIAFMAGAHDDGYAFDGEGGVLAHAFFPPDGKVHFDAQEYWTDKYDRNGINFRLVASHEIGHALGLEHSHEPSSLMYPFYQLIQPKDLLPIDDQNGIRALYGTSETNRPTTFPPTTTRVTTTKKGKTTRKPTKTTKSQEFSHDRCARYLDVVFGGGRDKWLYTLDYDLAWRYHPDYGHWDTRGLPITEVFPGAEPHMMAGILSPVTEKIYLFKDNRVWRFTLPNSLDNGFPKHIYGTGTPYNPTAALYEKGHILLLKSGLLYKFDENTLHYDFHQPPKRISEQFSGIPKSVRTAFTHDGKHYFFTSPDRYVYIFNTKTRRIESGYPKPMTTGWFACKEN